MDSSNEQWEIVKSDPQDSSNEHWEIVQSDLQDSRTSFVPSQLTSLSLFDEPQIPVGVTLYPGLSPEGTSMTFCSGFPCRLVGDFYGDEAKRERKWLRKGELVSISGIKPGEPHTNCLFCRNSDIFLGYLMTHGPGREDIGWVDFKFLEVYALDRDPTIYRDTSKPANQIPWYHTNPHRNGSREDAEKIATYVKYMPNFQSLGFLMGYCVIGLKDEGKQYDLENLPKMLESWPVKYELRKDERKRKRESDEQIRASLPP
jgi:hypothetical protein